MFETAVGAAKFVPMLVVTEPVGTGVSRMADDDTVTEVEVTSALVIGSRLTPLIRDGLRTLPAWTSGA